MEAIRKSFNPVGEIEIWKQYSNGESELYFSDHNVITSGLGLGFAYLYAGSGAVATIADFQITNFQVGAKGSFDDYGSSTTALTEPLSGAQYAGGELVIDQNSCNNLAYPNGSQIKLSEVGLYMRNPNGFEIPARLISAYRPFTPIYKTNNFALIFKWTLKF